MTETLDFTNAGAALGIGLLVGLERERRKGEGDRRDFAGLRTFAITSLLGYLTAHAHHCAFAGDHQCDVIVMGTTQHRGLDRRLGSTAEQVLQRAPCSVLAIKPGE